MLETRTARHTNCVYLFLSLDVLTAFMAEPTIEVHPCRSNDGVGRAACDQRSRPRGRRHGGGVGQVCRWSRRCCPRGLQSRPQCWAQRSCASGSAANGVCGVSADERGVGGAVQGAGGAEIGQSLAGVDRVLLKSAHMRHAAEGGPNQLDFRTRFGRTWTMSPLERTETVRGGPGLGQMWADVSNTRSNPARIWPPMSAKLGRSRARIG